MKILYTDGGCSGNNIKNNPHREMVAVVSNEEGEIISDQKYFGGSNNIAELMAIKNALSFCDEVGIKDVEIRTDSRNNFSWVYGKIGKKLNDRAAVVAIRERMKPLMDRINLKLVWVPREDNLAGHYIEEHYSL